MSQQSRNGYVMLPATWSTTAKTGMYMPPGIKGLLRLAYIFHVNIKKKKKGAHLF